MIVIFFKFIDVQHNQADRLVANARIGDFTFEHLQEGAVVERAGQRIAAGLVFNFGVVGGIIQRHGSLLGEVLQHFQAALIELIRFIRSHRHDAKNPAAGFQWDTHPRMTQLRLADRGHLDPIFDSGFISHIS